MRPGERAPNFTLRAANRFDESGEPQEFSLAQMLTRGPVVLEFLRGTW